MILRSAAKLWQKSAHFRNAGGLAVEMTGVPSQFGFVASVLIPMLAAVESVTLPFLSPKQPWLFRGFFLTYQTTYAPDLSAARQSA